jgi:phytoene synthase
VIQHEPPERPHGRGGLTLACRLLPGQVRGDALLLYSALRRIDDLVDGGAPEAGERVEALERWAVTGAPTSPEADVLERVWRRHHVPRSAVVEFCRGMREDLDRRPMRTEAELDRYCHRVAGTVGLMVTAMLGTRGPCLAAASTLGAAMQRTNILRDLDEDLARGRTYLAEETIARFGAPTPGRREGLVRDQIVRADRLYERGIAGIPALARGRWAIAAAAATYREILRQIEREGYGRRPGRAVVSPARRALVAARLGVAVARRPAPRAAATGHEEAWAAGLDAREADPLVGRLPAADRTGLVAPGRG